MKVVLFCGGLGMRLRDYSETIPKPMVNIGDRPILWHVMKYYAHYGHKDFILCLGHRADAVKNYFLNYNECASNDFVLSAGGKNLELLNSDIQDWRITFTDTGINSNIGQRLKAVEKYLDGEDEFLANYSDGLTDLPLTQQLEHFHQQDKIASFLCVRPNLSYHLVSLQQDQANLAIDVECNAADLEPDQSAQRCERHREQHRKRQCPAFIKCCQEQIREHDREQIRRGFLPRR